MCDSLQSRFVRGRYPGLHHSILSHQSGCEIERSIRNGPIYLMTASSSSSLPMTLTRILIPEPEMLRWRPYTLQHRSCQSPIRTSPNHPPPSSTHLHRPILFIALVRKIRFFPATSRVQSTKSVFLLQTRYPCALNLTL